jgi:release factor glutamine methyltransferase
LPEAALAAGTSIAGTLRAAAGGLAAAGSATPRLDAELLLAHALGVGRERLVLDARAPVELETLERFDALLSRRVAREPVAYIVGRREFRRISLCVDSRVLIPRPETELLVEVGLALPAGARVADVGTGSGAVALALKDERPDLAVCGADIDPDALEVARDNARRLGLKVPFVRADLLDGVPEPVDAVLANLPYVAAGTPLAPEIRLYEPRRALFAGEDGLDLVRRLIPMTGGVPLVALEIGFDQASRVAELLGRCGFTAAERLRDLAGHERVVVARR